MKSSKGKLTPSNLMAAGKSLHNNQDFFTRSDKVAASSFRRRRRRHRFSLTHLDHCALRFYPQFPAIFRSLSYNPDASSVPSITMSTPLSSSQRFGSGKYESVSSLVDAVSSLSFPLLSVPKSHPFACLS